MRKMNRLTGDEERLAVSPRGMGLVRRAHNDRKEGAGNDSTYVPLVDK